MEDDAIIELYWQRKEDAIRETAAKYGPLLFQIAKRIVGIPQDCEEVLNDTYLKAWNAIPPHRPKQLSSFLAKIARELAIDRFRTDHRQKRMASEYLLSLEEIGEIVSGKETPEDAMCEAQLAEAIRVFLKTLPAKDRTLFVQRYFLAESFPAIARKRGEKEATLKTRLYRIRKQLREYLKAEGFEL